MSRGRKTIEIIGISDKWKDAAQIAITGAAGVH
jgi:hypothetical protein